MARLPISPYFVSTFQNTGDRRVDQAIERLARRPATGNDLSSGTWVMIVIARVCASSAMARCLAGSVSREYFSRKRSVVSSHGQPARALSQLAWRNGVISG